MVKDKSSNSRIFDKDGFRKRAACICVKNEDETEVLLVSSSKYPERWIVPGGGVEQDETNAETAVREIKEEAGVVGRLSRCLGLFENEEHKHRTEVFVLIVTEEQEEWDDSKTIGRKRHWFSIEEALEKLAQHKPNQINYLKKLKSFPLTT